MPKHTLSQLQSIVGVKHAGHRVKGFRDVRYIQLYLGVCTLRSILPLLRTLQSNEVEFVAYLRQGNKATHILSSSRDQSGKYKFYSSGGRIVNRIRFYYHT